MASPRTLPAAGGGPPNPAHLPLFTVLSAYADALDALPLDLTRSFSDLRELDAVLGTHLSSLTARLYTLASALSDPELTPAQRLLALKDCAEEARAYKEGGEDKIRVAVNTAETIASHTDFIDRLANGILGSTIPELAPALRPSSGRFLHHSRVPYDPQRDRYMIDTVTEDDLPESYNSVEYAITTLKAQAAANGELGGSSSTKSNNALASRFNLNLQAGGTGSSFGMLGPSFHTHHGAGAAAAAVAAAAVLNRPNATSSTASGSGGGAGGAAGSSGGTAGHSAAGGTERGANASGSGSHGGGHGGASGSGSAHDRHSSSHTAAHHHHHQSASSSSTHHRSERAGGSSSHHAHAAAQGSSHSERHGSHASAQHSGGGGSHSRSAHQHSNNNSNSHSNSHHSAAHANETSHSTSSRSHSSHHAHANSASAGNHGSGASHSTSVRESNKGSFGGSSSRGVAASHSASNNNNASNASAAAVAASSGMNMSEDQEDQTRYCYCQQVSYGEMIACDSRDCPYEWFHLVCVNLTVVPPEGSKWYCDHCLEKRAKKKGKSGARGAR